MTRLIITRHGQSIANAECRFAGQTDFDLSDLGYAQAECVGKYISQNFKIDHIYSSDLLRAYNTALAIAKRVNLKVIPTTALREIYAGAWEGHTTDEIKLEYEHDFSIWRNDYANCRCTGGESTKEVYRRAISTVKELAEQHPEGTLLLSTHATLVRAICAYSQGLDESRVGEIPFAYNASINVFTYDDGNLIPERLNIIEHLGDMVTKFHHSFG